MTRFRLWHLKNEMLAANFLANFIGIVLIKLFLLRTEGSIPEEFLTTHQVLFKCEIR
jgi:hypothetical protein